MPRPLPFPDRLGRWVAVALVGLCTVGAVRAQPEGRRLGIGGQVGSPSGFTLKVYPAAALPLGAKAVDFLAAWDLDEVFFINAHLLGEQPIEDSPLGVFLGPGGLLGLEATPRGAAVVMGLSGTVGVHFYQARFEVYLQLTPRLTLTPNVYGRFGGGVGLRYYLR